jgi:hypothetical protein
LLSSLQDGPEEVVLQAEQAVEAPQDGPGGAGAVAVIADEAADEQAVALLDPGLIVLAIGPAAGKANLAALTPTQQAVIDELAAVVAVPVAQGKGQPVATAWMPPVTR